MSHYIRKFTINADAHALYQAITTNEGCKAWWTLQSEVGDTVGSQATFRFGKTHWTFEIKELERDHKVMWHCTDQFVDASFSKTDEWVGTTVVFNISNLGNGVLLHFEHIGLDNQLECWEVCQRGWDFFLGTSLKAYLENGKGMPHETN